MKKNSRFVLLNCKTGAYSVYDGKTMLARYEQTDPEHHQYLSKEELEGLRLMEFKDSA